MLVRVCFVRVWWRARARVVECTCDVVKCAFACRSVSMRAWLCASVRHCAHCCVCVRAWLRARARVEACACACGGVHVWLIARARLVVFARAWWHARARVVACARTRQTGLAGRPAFV